MKLALLTALSLPFVPAAVGENYVQTVLHEVLGAEQLAASETTSCTHFNINRGEEGCAAGEMCKIGVRDCLRRIRRINGVCYTRPERCTADFNPVCGCDGVTYSNECSALGAGVNIMNVGCCSDDEECKDSLEPDEPTPVEPTTCTHFNINKGEEGCAAGEMCKIGVRDCLRRKSEMKGVCYTRPEMCTADFNPVCGCDGVTYSNECSALSVGVNIMRVGCCYNDEECKASLEPNEPTPVEPTTCTYFNINKEEGCSDDDMCKIGVGNCRRRIRRQEGVCYTRPEMCTADFNPVCGCDGVTYSNECSALVAGVNIMNVGCCSDDEECKASLEPDEPDYRCSTDTNPAQQPFPICPGNSDDDYCDGSYDCGSGYGFCDCQVGQDFCEGGSNPCNDIKDPLEPDEPTPVEPTPCTYFNENDAEGCAAGDMCKVGVGNCLLYIAFQDGVCVTPPEVCTADWNPVCGCDGVTYSNECKALGRGVNVQSVGACRDDDESEDSTPTEWPTRSPPSNDYRCSTDTNPAQQPFPICPGNSDDDYCDGGYDCDSGFGFCDCQVGQDFCDWGVNPCNDIHLETNN